MLVPITGRDTKVRFRTRSPRSRTCGDSHTAADEESRPLVAQGSIYRHSTANPVEVEVPLIRMKPAGGRSRIGRSMLRSLAGAAVLLLFLVVAPAATAG